MACVCSSCNPSRCTINYDDSSMDDDESSVYETFTKPIRVINIEKTLEDKKGIHFLKPQDWKFHVLSHTWSLMVRDLSKKIGDSIGFSTSRDEDAYNSAFEKEDFSKELCYKPLLEVFEILRADGVRLIWFDALCINQSSVDEKNQEINNMGQYFSLSIGSYVLTHGVGEVNKLWGKVRGDDLPRWFTRVWTFQEFLLPKQVSFLVEGEVDPKFVRMVNHLIQEKRKIGLCRCFLKMDSQELDDLMCSSLSDEEDLRWVGGFELRNPKWKSIVQLIRERQAPLSCTSTISDSNGSQNWILGPTHYGYQDTCCKGDTKTNKTYSRDLFHKKMQHTDATIQKNTKQEENNKLTPKAPWDVTNSDNKKSITCNDLTCKECGSRGMIRRAKYISGHDEVSYFVDREVFLAMMQCDSRIADKRVEGVEKGGEPKKPTEGIQALRGLYCALATEGNWRPCHVICEVGWRRCTVEEDRVLASLGLLGLTLKKLRTGRSLRDQILELAIAGGSPMLVELCIMNQKGGSLPGMSWAPDFHGHNQKLEDASRPRTVSIQVESLGQDGRLQVKAKMAWGKVVPFDSKQQTKVGQVSQYRLVIHNDAPNEDIFMSLELKTKIEYPTSKDKDKRLRYILHFDFKEKDNIIQMYGSFEIPIYTIHTLDGGVSIPIRLVLLGEDEVERKLLLVCVAKKPSKQVIDPCEELHKVGSIAIKDMPTSLQSTLNSCNLHACVIGGFGKDLIDCINLY